MMNKNIKKNTEILVGFGTCGIAAGSKDIFNIIKNIIKNNVHLKKTGCIGLCYCEPNIEIIIDNKTFLYGNVTTNNVITILKEFDLCKKNVLLKKEYNENPKLIKKDWYYPELEENHHNVKQARIVLKNIGRIDPENIQDYISNNGYEALKKVLLSMKPKDVISQIQGSMLRGRGGGGFPTGTKWKLASEQQSDIKYVICNADEGNPGAFMDRAILEGDPHSVIEGMIIAGYAINANHGYIYIRAEYPLAIERLNIAIKQASKIGLIGTNILGTNYNFNLKLNYGAGSFVCGEETALINSISGKRGIPISKPPYPAVEGLNKKPTVINNVETLANICPIIRNGSNWYKKIGTPSSTGTKVFSLTKRAKKTGLVEVPMGTTLNDIIYDLGDGVEDNLKLKAIQIGGPSGNFITTKNMKIPMDYESLTSIGSTIGTGGIIVISQEDSIVNIVKSFMDFAVKESCGKCVPCRIGSVHLLNILNKITDRNATIEDIVTLEELSFMIKKTSFCGFGSTMTENVLSSIKHFKKEYMNYIK